MGDRDHQPYLEPLLAEQVDYYRARRPVHLATRSALRGCLLRFLALPRPARTVRVLLVAGRWGPRSGWPGLLRRRWLPNARRADRGRGVVDNTPAPARRHSVPRGQGPVSPGRARALAQAPGMAGRGAPDLRAVLLGLRHPAL